MLSNVIDFNLTFQHEASGVKGQRIGYVRVSTFDQNVDRQLEGQPLDRIFTDKASGKDVNRPQLDAMLAFAREGDTIVVHSMDRLGLSQVLVEAAEYEDGLPVARNFDAYPILPPQLMANVHVKIVESGAKMGGIGEPPLPAVPPAVVNAVSALTGRRVRTMPLSKETFTA